MPSNPPAASKPGSGKAGSFLTQKLGPLPIWGWIAVAAVGLYLYRKNQASSASTNAQSSNATVPTESVTTAAGTYSGPVGYDPLGGGGGGGGTTTVTTPGTTSTATPGSGGNSTPTSSAGPVVGSGYENIGTGPAIGNTGTQYEGIPNGQTAAQLISSGIPIYYQPTPGNYVKTTGAGLQPGTELYQANG